MFKIAISGKAKSGKNTLSNLIIKELIKYLPKDSNKKYETHAFADPIKKMINIMFPGKIHKSALWGPSECREKLIEEAEIQLPYRQTLLDIGSLGRSYHNMLWVNLLLKKFNKAKLNNVPIFVVSDLRFKNEYNALCENNFYKIRIVRSIQNKSYDVSETEQDEILNSQFDYVIVNNSTKKSLKDKTSVIIQDILTYNAKEFPVL